MEAVLKILSVYLFQMNSPQSITEETVDGDGIISYHPPFS